MVANKRITPKKKDVIEFLDHSNRIEREKDERALKDAIKAWDYAYKNRYNGITTNYILKIHSILVGRLRPDIAGQVRHCTVYVGDRVCPYISDELILSDLKNWTKDCYVNSKNWKLISEQDIKDWHIRLMGIHPFEDGNGRTGRIIYNIQRLRAKLPIHIIHEHYEQYEYYKWFNKDIKNPFDYTKFLKDI